MGVWFDDVRGHDERSDCIITTPRGVDIALGGAVLYVRMGPGLMSCDGFGVM